MAHLFLKFIIACIAQEAFVASAAGAQCPLPNVVEQIVNDDVSLLQNTLNMKQRVDQKTGLAGVFCCCTKPDTFTENDCIQTGKKYHEEYKQQYPEYAGGQYSYMHSKKRQYSYASGKQTSGEEIPEADAHLALVGWDPVNKQCCRYKDSGHLFGANMDCNSFARKGVSNAKFSITKGYTEKGSTEPHCEAVILDGLTRAAAEARALALVYARARYAALGSGSAAENAHATSSSSKEAQAQVVVENAAKEESRAREAKRAERGKKRAEEEAAHDQVNTPKCSVAADAGNCHNVPEGSQCDHYWYTSKFGNPKMCRKGGGLFLRQYHCGHSKNPLTSSGDCPLKSMAVVAMRLNELNPSEVVALLKHPAALAKLARA